MRRCADDRNAPSCRQSTCVCANAIASNNKYSHSGMERRQPDIVPNIQHGTIRGGKHTSPAACPVIIAFFQSPGRVADKFAADDLHGY